MFIVKISSITVIGVQLHNNDVKKKKDVFFSLCLKKIKIEKSYRQHFQNDPS